jgi:hypothetical protein
MINAPAPGDQVVLADALADDDPVIGRVVDPDRYVATDADRSREQLGDDIEVAVLVRWSPDCIRWEYIDDLAMWRSA